MITCTPRSRPSGLATACAGLCLLLATSARADATLEQDRIRALLLKGLPAGSHQPRIELRNTSDQCRDPQPFLPRPEQRGFGQVMVGVRCPGQTPAVHYVQASVAAMGSYVVNVRKIAAGQVIEADMLAMKSGPLEQLPANAALSFKEVVGLSAQRAFSPSSPLLLTALRKTWVVQQNHQVAVEVQGEGFVIRREGKALGNGYLGDEVRVVSGKGKVLQGTVTGPDRLLVRY